MFQSFNDPTDPDSGAGRVAALRSELKRLGLTGLVVPHADEHQSEYLPASAERLAWLTGFTGSAGAAVVLMDRAALFVDGRYTLQATTQADAKIFEIVDLIASPPTKWLAEKLKPGDKIGFDPWLMTIAETRRFNETCEAAGAEFLRVDENPIDRLWSDRPDPPLGQVTLQPIEYSGEAASDKIARIQKILSDRKIDATILTLADSIAWTFNIRGNDIAHNPVTLANAILPRTGTPKLFVDGRKLSNTVRNALAEIAEIGEPSEFDGALKALGTSSAKVLIDPKATASAIGEALAKAGANIVEGGDPTIWPKARKNETELAGSRRAHIRDGAAMVRFLAWLERTVHDGGLDEIAATTKLEEFRADTARRDGAELADISFDTIAGAGPNGAIVHYRVTRKTTRQLEPGMLFLLDSGGQYRDGTTDITRTIAIGAPSEEMRERYTLVLRGHIAVATARFPAGTNGAQLDGLARRPLWQAGLDFDHGTGHGVGAFLSVHEGPARIAKTGTVALETGMILSNEPGYYKTGAYGIRIENLVAVMPPSQIAGGERPMHGFETLSLCPFDRRLIDETLLSPEEVAWINAYHARLSPALDRLLDQEERDWLAEATKPLR
jgi:Xaa-Pro aminopeptidase